MSQDNYAPKCMGSLRYYEMYEHDDVPAYKCYIAAMDGSEVVEYLTATYIQESKKSSPCIYGMFPSIMLDRKPNLYDINTGRVTPGQGNPAPHSGVCVLV